MATTLTPLAERELVQDIAHIAAVLTITKDNANAKPGESTYYAHNKFHDLYDGIMYARMERTGAFESRQAMDHWLAENF